MPRTSEIMCGLLGHDGLAHRTSSGSGLVHMYGFKV